MNNKPSRSKVAEEIDANLRRVYEEVLKDEVPDRFSDLLNRLKSGESAPEIPASGEGDD
jgi:Anti-sigma factor NepR